MAQCFIYKLIDPSYHNEVKYIGYTSDFDLRKQNILDKEKIGKDLKKWIESLERREYEPTVVLLEEVEEEDIDKRYRYWTKYYKDQGNVLLNKLFGNKKRRYNFTRKR